MKKNLKNMKKWEVFEMRIIHTSDWHLGKNLEGKSRLPEQEVFIEEFIELIEERDIQLVLIAGDIYDTINPPADAEKLFYRSIKKISAGGKRVVVIISGNHDHPERLGASNPIARDDGILIFSHPKSQVEKGPCGHHQVIESGQGFVELDIEGQRVVVLTVAYPSEKRLGEVLFDTLDDEGEMQKDYSSRLGQFFGQLEEQFREDTINIAMSHLYVIGGEESSSERTIQLGGSYAVNAWDLPLKADYIALGHLHKPQKIKNSKEIPVYYSGSPLQYSKSERGYVKGCYILDAKASKPIEIERVTFNNHQPIEIWRFQSVEEALARCEKERERSVWIYMEIETEDYISNEDIRQLKKLKKDIVEIKPIHKEMETSMESEEIEEQSIEELFIEFYEKDKGVKPQDDLLKMFLSLIEEEESQ